MALPSIAMVWLNRDLRLLDHEPLVRAQQTGLPVLLLYCFEPSVMGNPDSDVRHWRFVHESIEAMQLRLRAHNARVYMFQGEMAPVLDCLREKYTPKYVFSHQETGNKITFDRDVAMKACFQQNGIGWLECRTNGIIRKLKSRANWDQRWETAMTQASLHPDDLERHLARDITSSFCPVEA